MKKRGCEECGRAIYVKVTHPSDKFTSHHTLCRKCFQTVYTKNVPKPRNQNNGVHA